jgi:hypothetical protein
LTKVKMSDTVAQDARLEFAENAGRDEKNGVPYSLSEDRCSKAQKIERPNGKHATPWGEINLVAADVWKTFDQLRPI